MPPQYFVSPSLVPAIGFCLIGQHSYWKTNWFQIWEWLQKRPQTSSLEKKCNIGQVLSVVWGPVDPQSPIQTPSNPVSIPPSHKHSQAGPVMSTSDLANTQWDSLHSLVQPSKTRCWKEPTATIWLIWYPPKASADSSLCFYSTEQRGHKCKCDN